MQASSVTNQATRPLRRPRDGRMIGGVAAGLADYLDVDVSVVRVGLVVLALVGALGFPIYLAAWLFVPDEYDDESLAERFLGHGCPGQARGAGNSASATEMASAPRRADAPWATRPGPGQATPAAPPAGAGPEDEQPTPAPPAGAGPEPRRSHDAAPS